MEQRKIARMKNYDGEQDIGLYYKGGVSDKTNIAPKIETAFNAKSSSESSSQGSSSKMGFSSYSSFDPNFSATKSGKVLQCNIALNLENDQNYSEEVEKSHMSLLVIVLESYRSLVAGRIGNPMLTKEDYDQVDAEEMELMDIKWCLANVLRRAEKFKQITGRDDFRDANASTLGFDKSKVTCFRCREKGHFKRECTNREASGAQNPFSNNDYYRKAIYHQVAQQPYQQQTQTAHARKEIEESKTAYLVNQDDERSSKGFSWDKYISANSKACLTDQDDERLPKDFSWDDYDPNRTADHEAFVAQKVEDDDNDYWANSMKEHLKYLAERDAERKAENAQMEKKKEVKQQDDSDDDYWADKMKEHLRFLAERDAERKKGKNDEEEVRVVKQKEIPAFEIKKEAVAEKASKNCENCETLKKYNNELIHNMNRLKESYDVLNKAMNQYNESSNEQATAMKTLNGAYMIKQEMINYYIGMCAELEHKLETQRIETERVNKLLKSYSCSSYVIDRIYPIADGMKAFEEVKSEVKNSETKEDTEVKNSSKKESVSYNKCPPPLENGYSPRNPNSERVKKATNLQWESEPSDNLPDNVDVMFTSSDTDHESEMIKKVVDQVLDKDETEESKSESKSDTSNPKVKQGKRVYNKEFLLSQNNLNDETFKVVYTLNDSDKLYSDEEFPIRSVKTEMINKVFKLTEINISEIKDVNLTEKPKTYTSRVQQRLNKKKGYSSGSGYRKKPNYNGNFKKKGLGFIPLENHKNKKVYKTKTVFVSGTSSEEEKEHLFRK
ncbi:putative transcription factor interactor and regulator CCHC(Zn) family [Helianthus annuus]|nr:putative transcription factor interactor and regulator CCHC(Zn) family [Helianthus annuus]